MVKYKITHGLPSVGWTKMKISRSGGHAPPKRVTICVEHEKQNYILCRFKQEKLSLSQQLRKQ